MNNNIQALLTATQVNKLKKNLGIQLSKKQLAGDDPKATKLTDLMVDDKTLKKLNKGTAGVRIVAGSGLFSSVSKSISKGVKKASKDIKKATKDASKAINKADVGSYIEAGQNIIPEEYSKEAIKMALISTGMDPVSADVAASASAGAFYEVDFSKNLKNQEGAAIKGGLKGAASSGGGLNNAQRKLMISQSQESYDSQRRKDVKKKQNHNGETIQAQNMIKQGPSSDGLSYGNGYGPIGSGFRAYNSQSGNGYNPAGGSILKSLKKSVKSIANDKDVQKFIKDEGTKYAKSKLADYQTKTKEGSGFKPAGSGAGEDRGKGSQYQKDRMRMLRERRTVKSGKGMISF